LDNSIQLLTYQGKTEFVVSSITIVDPTDVSVLSAFLSGRDSRNMKQAGTETVVDIR